MTRRKGRTVGEGVDHVTCRLCGREFRVVNWPHLVTVHGFDPQEFLLAYARRFPGASHISRATKRRMRQGQDEWNGRTGRRWTKHRILQSIRQERRRLGRTPTVNDVPETLRVAAQRHFGGWVPAVLAAGLHHRYGRDGRLWTRARVLAEIRRRVASDRSVRFAAAHREGAGLTVGAKREFGSWKAAVRAAGYGLLLPAPPRSWSKPAIYHLLRRIVRKHGYASLSLLRRARRPGYVSPNWAVGRLFPSLEVAICRARIGTGRRPVWQRPDWIKWSPAQILEVLRHRVRAQLPVNAAAIQKVQCSLYRAAVRRFGSWPQTLARLGLDPDRVRRKQGRKASRAFPSAARIC